MQILKQNYTVLLVLYMFRHSHTIQSSFIVKSESRLSEMILRNQSWSHFCWYMLQFYTHQTQFSMHLHHDCLTEQSVIFQQIISESKAFRSHVVFLMGKHVLFLWYEVQYWLKVGSILRNESAISLTILFIIWSMGGVDKIMCESRRPNDNGMFAVWEMWKSSTSSGVNVAYMKEYPPADYKCVAYNFSSVFVPDRSEWYICSEMIRCPNNHLVNVIT